MKTIITLTLLAALAGCGGGDNDTLISSDTGGTSDAGDSLIPFEQLAGDYTLGACYTSDALIQPASGEFVNMKESVAPLEHDVTGPTLEQVNYTYTYHEPSDTTCSGPAIAKVVTGIIVGQDGGTTTVDYAGRQRVAHRVDLFKYNPLPTDGSVVLKAGVSSINLAYQPQLEWQATTLKFKSLVVLVDDELVFGDTGGPLDADGYPTTVLPYSRLKR